MQFSLLHVKLHIVNLKSSYSGNTTQGVADSEGLAALGFFIEVSLLAFKCITHRAGAWKFELTSVWLEI